MAMHAMCEFALNRMGISKRIRNNISLNIHMRHNENEGEAVLSSDANRYRPRDFKIVLDHHRMSKDDYNRDLEDTEWGHRVLKTLAHELVHVKQYIMGELTWRERGLLWKGSLTVPETFMEYYELPYAVSYTHLTLPTKA